MYSSFDSPEYFPQFLYLGLLWIEFPRQDVGSWHLIPQALFYEKQVKIVHKKLATLLAIQISN